MISASAASAVELPLLEFLAKQGIRYEMFRHPTVLTVAEANLHMTDIPPGLHVKNLFLKDKKKQRRWVVSVPDDAKVDLKALGKTLGAAGNNLSFASDLTEVLGILPGSVTPLAVFNDQPVEESGGAAQSRVTSVLDRSLVAADAHPLVFVHPLHSEATIGISPADLLKFLDAVGHPPVLIDCARDSSSDQTGTLLLKEDSLGSSGSTGSGNGAGASNGAASGGTGGTSSSKESGSSRAAASGSGSSAALASLDSTVHVGDEFNTRAFYSLELNSCPA